MRTQHKLIIVLFISFLISATTIIIVFLINNKQREIVIESQKNQLQKNINALFDWNTKIVTQTIDDYTTWDEMGKFIHSKSKEWADENLKTMLPTFKINAIWIFDSLKNNLYFESANKYNHSSVFPLSNSIIDTLHRNKFVHSLLYIHPDIIEINGATIHPTLDRERHTTPQGYFFVAKVWSGQYLHLIEQITETKLKPSKIPINYHVPKEKNKILVDLPLLDWQKNVIRYIAVEKQLNSLEVYQSASNLIPEIIIFSALLTFGIFAYASRKLVTNPLRLIEKILAENSLDQIPKLKLFSKEFKNIANLIVDFFNKNDQLREATKKAEKASQLKTAFLTNMSHEVRTPMNGIIGYSELLVRSNELAARKDLYVNCIKKSCDDLLHIINDILDISKIEAGEVEIDYQTFSINCLFDELNELFKKKIIFFENNRIPIHFINTCSDSDCLIHSDKRILHKILFNLIDNAIKFTNKGLIEISYYPEGDNWIFYVKDTGIGIAHDKTEIIFDSFCQVDGSKTRLFGGNGLGLAICKGFIELLGGNIWVNSKLHEGSTFYFSLPHSSLTINNFYSYETKPL